MMSLFIIKYKWGFDGSSSHSIYKQRYLEDIDSTDSQMFLTSIELLQTITKRDNDLEDIIWENPHPSSTRFCFPI